MQRRRSYGVTWYTVEVVVLMLALQEVVGMSKSSSVGMYVGMMLVVCCVGMLRVS